MELRHGRYSLCSGSPFFRKFLNLSHWFREKLLTLETPNVKERFMFSEKSLLSLPERISSDDIRIPIDPFEEKLQKINDQLKGLI